MKLWRASYYDPRSAFTLSILWAGSRDVMNKAIAGIRKESGEKLQDLEVKAVDVPTAKKDLIAWLNTNVKGVG